MKQLKVKSIRMLPPAPEPVKVPQCQGVAHPCSPAVIRRNSFTQVQFYKCQACGAVKRREARQTDLDAGVVTLSLPQLCRELDPPTGKWATI